MIERYTLPKMGRVWKDEARFEKMLQVEILAAEALAKLKLVPNKALANIKRKAKFNVKRINEIEKKTKHDVIAFVQNVSQSVGSDGRYIHMGLTSSDVLDTALACLLRDASDILLEDLSKLASVLKKQAKRYKNLACVGRTHGVHAEPTTFGLKFALFYDETLRNIGRMEHAKQAISIGKISGAVGTYANINPFVEGYACKKLGLKAAKISTQIVQRDVHAEFLGIIALIGSSLEKFALEIRNLQRTEVREAEEPFSEGQKGSSAMPHKRNPVICERVCGLSRVLRGNALACMESVALWHERDISHSSVERVVLPDSTILLDYMLNLMIEVFDGLLVYPKNIQANFEKTKGLLFSQRAMLALIRKGLSRQDAYDIVQKNAMKSWHDGSDFRELLFKNEEVRRSFSADELRKVFDVRYFLRHTNAIFRRLGI